ncbi:hypothetical protein T484DRAFT_2277671 [Baffinella frigidus]|nr:hypothetical protein T484DRAFT_2277671 [Cryptophyta sp. CCMP2293]
MKLARSYPALTRGRELPPASPSRGGPIYPETGLSVPRRAHPRPSLTEDRGRGETSSSPSPRGWKREHFKCGVVKFITSHGQANSPRNVTKRDIYVKITTQRSSCKGLVKLKL